MSTMIFVNLPVADLKKSMAFFEALGWHFNPQFTDDTAACLVISDTVHAMLHTHASFRRFTPKAICDAHTTSEVLIALSCDSRAQVDERVGKAMAAGAKPFREPQDHGFMYERAFQDLDGHVWEMMWMDPAAVQ